MSVINTNVSSLQAQNSLHKNESKLSSAMERLSSGVRINSAKDDAAGLAITTRMTSEIRGLTQAVRNANDGISVAQTAEGSLGEITNILQRLRELAVQSANASNNATDRSFLNTEAQQLIDETQRIGSQTNFNGIKLLDGSFNAQNFQVGANRNEVIVFNSIADSTATGLGANQLNSFTGELGVVTASAATVPTAGFLAASGANFKIQTASGGTSAAISYSADTDAKTIAKAINDAANVVGVVATASNSVKFGTLTAAGTYSFTVNGGTTLTASVTSTSDLTSIAAAINANTAVSKVKASFASSSDKSEITLTSINGENIAIGDFTNTTGSATGSISLGTRVLVGDNGVAGKLDSALAVGTIQLSSSKGQINTSGSPAKLFSSPGGTESSSVVSVSTIDLSDPTNAAKALNVIDAALTQVNNTRAALGGLMNRFEATVSNQNTTIMNLSASRSRILDADYAVETTNLAKAQIIQQAATAMLAQANQSSQSVLALLK